MGGVVCIVTQVGDVYTTSNQEKGTLWQKYHNANVSGIAILLKSTAVRRRCDFPEVMALPLPTRPWNRGFQPTSRRRAGRLLYSYTHQDLPEFAVRIPCLTLSSLSTRLRWATNSTRSTSLTDRRLYSKITHVNKWRHVLYDVHTHRYTHTSSNDIDMLLPCSSPSRSFCFQSFEAKFWVARVANPFV